VPDLKEKAPEADLDFGFKYHRWLREGELIIDSAWQFIPRAGAGVATFDDNGIIELGESTSFQADGGKIGEIYECINSVVTDAIPPRPKTSRMFLRIVDQP
jgi:hypothetical protein